MIVNIWMSWMSILDLTKKRNHAEKRKKTTN